MEKMNYLLGVDGGNSKTDYLLYTEDLTFVDLYRTGTCSHEHFEDGFEGSFRVMGEQLSQLFLRNGIDVSQVSSAAFGLAGCDFLFQKKNLETCVSRLGFERFAVVNDGILGIKALSEDGTGVCAVNGTGTVVVGINKSGQSIQMGGIGPTLEDHAGGAYVFHQSFCRVYDELLCFGEKTTLTPRLMELLGLEAKEDFFERLSTVHDSDMLMQKVIQATDHCACEGDSVAQEIFFRMGRFLGKRIAGCLQALGLSENPSVILAGSLWHKIRFSGMIDTTQDRVLQHLGKAPEYKLLDGPPAIGALLYASELLGKKNLTEARQSLRNFLSTEKYEELVYGKISNCGKLTN